MTVMEVLAGETLPYVGTDGELWIVRGRCETPTRNAVALAEKKAARRWGRQVRAAAVLHGL